ncbi:hypothetical protein OG352_00545 [Streptomyces sp. NBC_01485]|nr:hypothetical protein [Streptomyces sp. NBC_01485]
MAPNPDAHARERCRRADIGDEVGFETKVAVAKAAMAKAVARRAAVSG